jgi:hypothetical protein
MKDRPVNATPLLDLRLGAHENIDGDPQRTKLSPQSDLLSMAIFDISLDHDEVQAGCV